MFFHASLGRHLHRYRCDAGGATLEHVDSTELPDTVQYVWPHPSLPVAYAVTSFKAPVGPAGSGHHAVALRRDGEGRLVPMGAPVALAHRPIHVSVDRGGRYLLVAYNNPSSLTVHPLDAQGRIGAAAAQPELDCGTFAHQVMTTPGNGRVILVARGFDASGSEPEVPGALKCFGWGDAGRLVPKQSVAPDGGYGFGPRHLAFHPVQPWAFVSLERQSTLQVFALDTEENIGPAPLSSVCYLEQPQARHPRQLGGTVHVHPSGRFVYAVNRADHTQARSGRDVFTGGENSLVVFSVDQESGRLEIVQRVPLPTFHVRTFSIHPGGSLLVAAGIQSMWVAEEGGLQEVPAALCLYRVGTDGRLTLAGKRDVDTSEGPQWWSGFLFNEQAQGD